MKKLLCTLAILAVTAFATPATCNDYDTFTPENSPYADDAGDCGLKRAGPYVYFRLHLLAWTGHH